MGVSGSLLRLVSMLVLTAVIGMSTTRAMCLLPCLLDDLIAPARVSVSLALPSTSSSAHRNTGPPPDRRALTEAPLPLRI